MEKRIVITGIGLTSPIGNDLTTMRKNLIDGVSGIAEHEIRYMGKRPAGICSFDEFKHQKKKTRRRGTRAGSISIYCANEALIDAKVDMDTLDRSRVGVFLGLTEHGNVETEEEVYQMHQNESNYNLWSIHHNPRTVANAPAGEVTLNLGITGPHFTVGSACAGGNMGLIQGVQQILLGEVDFALCGGVSESPATFGIFAAFNAQGALGSHVDPKKASRPLCKTRDGIVISEGGCIYHIETLESAEKRNAKIYGEIVGYAYNSDASDFVLPNTQRQIECMQKAIGRAGINPEEIDIVNLHATGTVMGDVNEVKAVKEMFGGNGKTHVNFTKGHIGHSMGAAGAIELAGNLPSFEDGYIHPGINVEELDPECEMENLVINKAIETNSVDYILNNSFGMLGINSSVIIRKV
jgi:3-oxoacyl-[acyl-carrier-protein] synthase II